MKTTGEPDAASLAARLADTLTSAEEIRDPAWRDAFRKVPRHVFIPDFATSEDTPDGTRYTLYTADGTDRPVWLDTAYTDQTLVTQIDGKPVRDALPGGSGHGWATSSSTAPGLMAWMLHTLGVRDGDRVLEVGSGTGYNAALLCERLGSEHVTTIDIDPQLTGHARERLARLGYLPTIATTDGRDGFPGNAPYDRIIATTSWPYLPAAWITQATPGGTILANITGLLGGAMVLATVHDDGTATGRFLPRWAGFMVARPAIPRVADIDALDTEEGTYDTGTTRLDPALLQDAAFAFVAQLHTVDARPYWGTHEDGRDLFGLISPDGSWAEIYPPDYAGRRHTEQGGPRRLWDLTEHAHRFWNDHDRPDWSHFGVTATSTTQHAWFNAPDSAHAWPLPMPATA